MQITIDIPQFVYDSIRNMTETNIIKTNEKALYNAIYHGKPLLRGKWLSHYGYCKRKGYIPSGLSTFWWCNQCEQGVEYPTNYCPNCGAEME